MTSLAADERALKRYLTEKRLDDFFVTIVEELLIEAPDNPVKFIIDYLANNFPDQAKECSFAKTFGRDGITPGLGGGFSLSEFGPLVDKAAAEAAEEEAEEAEEQRQRLREEGGTADAVAPEQPRERRGAVCGVSLPPESLAALPAPAKKTDEEAERIVSILRHSTLFKGLSEAELAASVGLMRPRDVSSGEEVYHEGDAASEMFLVDSGACEISMRKQGGRLRTELVTCTAGDAFGETALLYGAPRRATVRATTATRLWTIERVAFRTLLTSSSEQRRAARLKAVERVETLRNLSEVERLKLCDALVRKEYTEGEVVVQQHDAGEALFLVFEGELRCTQQLRPADPITEVARLSAGMHFGEIALLSDRPVAATISVASPAAVTLSIGREAFTRLFGPLVDVIKRDADGFNQWVADKI